MSRSILMPVRTVAEWGGVHEWTVDASKALIASGHAVTFIGAGDLFEERARATGAEFLTIDWESWDAAVPELLENPLVRESDLIFAHAPHGRMVGLEISKALGPEIFVMVHGAFHDQMYSWSQHVTGFLAASPSLVHFVQRFGRVEPWKVSLVANAAPNHLFERDTPTFIERTSDGKARVVTASRLSVDKIPQIPVVVETVQTAAKLRSDLNWHLDVYGDGPMRSLFGAKYREAFRGFDNVTVEFHGWITPDSMMDVLSEAAIGVVAGMGGVRTIAAGALCIGTGARSFVGMQSGDNLQAGLWSNFGDHGVMRFAPTSLYSDLEHALVGGGYDSTVGMSRRILRRTNSQEVVDGAMLSALRL